ncbi:MAG: XkdQ/YqbQ family protein [Anaerotignaceae bacterium]
MATVYIAKDSESIQNWGLLQYFEKINNGTNGKAKADAMLAMYNSKRRALSVAKAFGDARVRGGSLVPVILKLGDIDAKSYLLVDTAKHTFTADYHTMDLTLRGGLFV